MLSKFGSRSLFSKARAIVAVYNGSLYLPSDANCFQDSAGTIAGAKDAVVGMLLDLVGANHLTQATAGYKPILRKGTVTGGVSDGVGSWWLDFDGVDDQMQSPATPITGATGHSALAAFHTDTIVGTHSILDSDGGLRIVQLLRTDASTFQTVAFNTAVSVFLDASGVALTAGTKYVGAEVTTLTTAAAYINGSSNGSTAVTGTLQSGTQAISMGRILSGISQYFNGGIYGATHLPAAISARERQTLERYLASLAGVTL